MSNPLGLRPGSVLRDNDARSNPPNTEAPRTITVTAVATVNGRWFAYYDGGHRRSRVAFDRIYREGDGRRHSQGYTIQSL